MNQMIHDIEPVIKNIAPDFIFVHHEDDTHQDHRSLAKATISATRYIRNVLFYEGPTTQNFSPAIFVDIKETLEAKIAMLLAHRTQVQRPTSRGGDHRYRPFHAVFRGIQGRVPFAEAFVPQRLFINVTQVFRCPRCAEPSFPTTLDYGRLGRASVLASGLVPRGTGPPVRALLCALFGVGGAWRSFPHAALHLALLPRRSERVRVNLPTSFARPCSMPWPMSRRCRCSPTSIGDPTSILPTSRAGSRQDQGHHRPPPVRPAPDMKGSWPWTSQ
jgi:hypothetical protein